MPSAKVILVRSLAVGCILLATAFLLFSWGQTDAAFEHYYRDAHIMLLGLSLALGQYSILLKPTAMPGEVKMITRLGPITLSTLKGGPTIGAKRGAKILLGLSLFVTLLGVAILAYHLIKYNGMPPF